MMDALDEYGLELIHAPSFDRPVSSRYIAKLLLFQSGQLREFGELDEGDLNSLIVESFQISVDGMRIVVMLGSEKKTFYLKGERCDPS